MTLSQHFPALIERVKRSRKYRDLDLPDDMMLDLLKKEAVNASSTADLDDRFRTKLHNIIAPYLETIDYSFETKRLHKQPELLGDVAREKAWAEVLLSNHASSRERLPFLSELYATIWDEVGVPASILDLACALDPLGLPWMNLPEMTSYLAYDIHKPRVDFLNSYFAIAHPNARAFQQDILVNPPENQAEVAFFFKEAHRMEKREPGVLPRFFESIPAALLVVSLPATDLKGHHSLDGYHSALIRTSIEGKPWQMTETQVGGELLFFIRKTT
jgi:16S rRNA (guanine(1405)-N(7))-methyltransferase